jgi:hypothetical protein
LYQGNKKRENTNISLQNDVPIDKQFSRPRVCSASAWKKKPSAGPFYSDVVNPMPETSIIRACFKNYPIISGKSLWHWGMVDLHIP